MSALRRLASSFALVGCACRAAVAPSAVAAPSPSPWHAATTAAPTIAAAALPPDPAIARDDVQPALDDARTGTIVARRGATVTIDLDGEVALPVGARGQLLRHFERRLGSATLSGWLDVARVTIVEQNGRAVQLVVDEETARVTINGRKQDQLREGYRVRLERPAA